MYDGQKCFIPHQYITQVFKFLEVYVVLHQGFKPSGQVQEGDKVSHLLLMDGNLNLGEANHDQVVYLCWNFMFFELFSKKYMHIFLMWIW